MKTTKIITTITSKLLFLLLISTNLSSPLIAMLDDLPFPLHTLCKNIDVLGYDQNTVPTLKYYLLKNDPNQKDEHGNTPLYYLQRPEDHPDLIKDLIFCNGANPYVKNHDGLSPYDINAAFYTHFAPCWKNVELNNLKDPDGRWQMDISQYKARCIQKKYRFILKGNSQDQDEANNLEYNNDKGRTALFVVHSQNDSVLEKDYYDFTSQEFLGIMNFAETFLKKHNVENSNDQKNIIHVVIFNSQTLNEPFSIKKIAQYINGWSYKNSPLSFVAQSYGCGLTNIITHLLSVPEINYSIFDYHAQNSQEKMYQARIKTLIYINPLRFHSNNMGQRENVINQMMDIIRSKINGNINDKIIREKVHRKIEKMSSPINYDECFVFTTHVDKRIAHPSSLFMPTITSAAFGGALTLCSVVDIKELIHNTNYSEKKKEVAVYLGLFSLGAYLLKHAFNLNNGYNVSMDTDYLNETRPLNYFCFSKKGPVKFKIKGPTMYCLVEVNHKKIDPQNKNVLMYFSKAWQYLKKNYPLNTAGCGHFLVNFGCTNEHVLNNMQCFLDERNNLIRNMHDNKTPHKYWHIALKKLQDEQTIFDEKFFKLIETKLSEVNKKLYYDKMKEI